MFINNEWPIPAILRGSLHCTFEQPVSNVQWIEPFFQIPGQRVLQGQHCIFNQLLSECLACVLVKKHTISLLFFLYCAERFQEIGGGTGKPGITVELKKGFTQTSASSLAPLELQLFITKGPVWLGGVCLRKHILDTTWGQSF